MGMVKFIMKELQRKKPTLAQALTPIIFMVVALALGYRGIIQ